MVLTVRQFSQTWWREVCKKVKKALVFIDSELAECLHWNGGIMELFTAGAIGVKEFSSFETGQASHKKAVFLTSSPIFDFSEVILRDIIQNSKFEYCVLISVAHPSVQHLARGGENDMAALQNLEDEMLQWMGNMNYTVEIFYMPLFLAPITDSLFVTPAFKNVFPDLNDDVYEDNQLEIHHIVSCLHSWFTQLNVREFIFSLGPLSGILAGYLEDLPAAVNRRKTAVNRASLVLIDRTLDLLTPLKHNSDSLLDRILSVLPHLPGHTNDVAVNMTPICNTKVTSVLDDIYLAPGCLSQPNNTDICPKVMEWLIYKKQKEVLIGLNQYLSQLAPEVRPDRVMSRVTPHSLEKQVATFRGNNGAIMTNNGVIQQTLAVTQSLKSPRCSVLDLLASLESLQLQQGDGALVQIMQLIRTRHERKLPLDDILCLLMHLYSSSNEISFPDSEESQLENLLAEALFEDRNMLTGCLLKYVKPDDDESSVAEIAHQICETIQALPSARYEFLRDENGLLQQVIGDLFDPARPTIPELATKSQALADILKSGFSLLMNKPTMKHPLDNPQVIIFIIGGVTAREVRIVQELVSSSGLTTDVLVGGTRLVTPNDIMNSVLLNLVKV